MDSYHVALPFSALHSQVKSPAHILDGVQPVLVDYHEEKARKSEYVCSRSADAGAFLLIATTSLASDVECSRRSIDNPQVQCTFASACGLSHDLR